MLVVLADCLLVLHPGVVVGVGRRVDETERIQIERVVVGRDVDVLVGRRRRIGQIGAAHDVTDIVEQRQ